MCVEHLSIFPVQRIWYFGFLSVHCVYTHARRGKSFFISNGMHKNMCKKMCMHIFYLSVSINLKSVRYMKYSTYTCVSVGNTKTPAR